MALITIQVLEGLERGRVYEGLATPVTIGREDDNVIRLNDERVSRFHVKIQEDGGRIILTDLESTNGTRVNGRPVQLKVLQPGDQLGIGRCLLVYGSPEQIAARLGEMSDAGLAGSAPGDHTLAAPSAKANGSPDPLDAEDGELFPNGPPETPQCLSPVQRAQVSDMLAYVHERLRMVIESAVETPDDDVEGMQVPWAAWQKLLALELDLARSLRQVAEPDEA